MICTGTPWVTEFLDTTCRRWGLSTCIVDSALGSLTKAIVEQPLDAKPLCAIIVSHEVLRNELSLADSYVERH